MKKNLGVLLLILCGTGLSAGWIQLEIEGPVDPVLSSYIGEALKKAETEPDVQGVIIRMHTPGGLGQAMRDICDRILNCPLPVIVHIAPSGARAASAGFVIAMAADLVVMADQTTMGAAHPIDSSGGDLNKTLGEKVTNDMAAFVESLCDRHGRPKQMAIEAITLSRAYSVQQCLENGLADFSARDEAELIQSLASRTVEKHGRTFAFDTADRHVDYRLPSKTEQLLRMLINPNLAYFLLMFGLIGITFEITHPGAVFPGVIGAICLLLAFLAFQILPVNIIGILLVLLSLGLFIAEVKVQGFGILGIGGAVALVFGSLILFDTDVPEMRPALSMILTLCACFVLLFVFLATRVIKSSRQRVVTGAEGIIGESGVAREPIDSRKGRIAIHGELWNACSDEDIAAGEEIVVTALRGLCLTVRKKGEPHV